MSTHRIRSSGPLWVLALATACTVCAACTGPTVPPAARALVYGRGADAVILDPGKADDGESISVLAQVCEGLVRYADGTTRIEPALAESWETSTDGTEWTFRLRPGVEFHDGSPFNAQAVVYSLERLLDPQHPQHSPEFKNRSLYSDIAGVRAVDEHTVRLTTTGPSALLLHNLTVYTAWMVPPAAYAADPDAYAQRPIGTGPFRFVSWERGRRIVLEANPDWWGGKPPSERLILVPIQENSSRRNQLEAGGLHVMTGVNPIDVEPLRARQDVRVLEQPGMNTAYLCFNTTRPPFDDPRVRRAVAAAIDRGRIVKLNYKGHGQVAGSLVPPEIEGSYAYAPRAGASPEEARRLLAEAGLGEGFHCSLWHMPNPRPYLPEPKQVAQVIADDLEAVGFHVELVSYPWNMYLAKCQAGEFDMCLIGWTADVNDPDNFLGVLLGSESIGGSNYSRYSNAELDGILAEARTTLDPAGRRALYERAQTAIGAAMPVFPLVHSTQLAAVRAELQDFILMPTGSPRFHRARLAPAERP